VSLGALAKCAFLGKTGVILTLAKKMEARYGDTEKFRRIGVAIDILRKICSRIQKNPGHGFLWESEMCSLMKTLRIPIFTMQCSR